MQAQEKKPDWVEHYKTGNMAAIDSLGEKYYGIGVSENSYTESDRQAFVEFASQVKLQVSNIIDKEIEENDGGIKEKTKVSTKLMSEVRSQKEMKRGSITYRTRFCICFLLNNLLNLTP